jgi:hypothetical protein
MMMVLPKKKRAKTRFDKEKSQRKAKKRAGEQEAAKVYEDFVASFAEESGHSKTFVRGGTIQPDASGVDKDVTSSCASSGRVFHMSGGGGDPGDLKRLMMEVPAAEPPVIKPYVNEMIFFSCT